MTARPIALVAAITLVALGCGGIGARAAAPGAATINGCSVFPKPGDPGTSPGGSNEWNRDISTAPVDPMSATYVNSIGATASFHPDFGSNPSFGIPITLVGQSQPAVPIKFTQTPPPESDPGPYPIPRNARVEAGSDRHVLVAQSGTCLLYEMFSARKRKGRKGWSAGSGAKFDLRSDALRRDGFTSADTAGLPILPGLVRLSEVQAGTIDHALRFTAPRTQAGFIHPATHFASSSTDPNLPPMGLRLRLKASFDTSTFPADDQVILKALKTFGMFLADNGSPWFLSGETNSAWNDSDLDQLKMLTGNNFEVVAPQDPTIHH